MLRSLTLAYRKHSLPLIIGVSWAVDRLPLLTSSFVVFVDGSFPIPDLDVEFEICFCLVGVCRAG